MFYNNVLFARLSHFLCSFLLRLFCELSPLPLHESLRKIQKLALACLVNIRSVLSSPTFNSSADDKFFCIIT
jgi:hypothetical protein